MRVVRGLNRARWGFAINSKLIAQVGACNRPAGERPAAMGSQIFCHFRLLASRSRGRYAQRTLERAS
jgi:hypothetical protein